MRRTLTVLAMAAVMVLAMASVAFAANGNGANGVGACWGAAVSEARSSGMPSHPNYAGGLNAFVEAGHPIPAICG
jgi:hypothetical protein